MRRRQGVAILSCVIAVLLFGAIPALARANVPSFAVTLGSPAPGPADLMVAAPADTGAAPGAAPVETGVALVARPPKSPTTTSPASPAPIAPSPRASLAATPPSAVHRDQPLSSGGIGSAADLGPGVVEVTVPAPCTPSSQPTPAHAIAAVEVRQGCVRALVPAGAIVGKEVGWSPDGTWLLATVQHRVVRLARDGSWRQDLGGGGQARTVVLSPDGTHLAVVGVVPTGTRNQKPVVVVAAADGSAGHTIDSRVTGSPSWSPDSQAIAFVSNDGGVRVPDVLHLVGVDGREQGHRTFPGRALFGASGNAPDQVQLSPGDALLGRPLFLADGRIFQPAFIELPRPASGLWLDRSLAEVAGVDPPSDLRFNEGVSGPANVGAIVYTGSSGDDHLGRPVRRFDPRTGEAATVALDGAVPASSHRSGAVAFVQRDPAGRPQGLSVVDGAGAMSTVWRHTGTSCACVGSGPPAWTADDGALALVGSGS